MEDKILRFMRMTGETSREVAVGYLMAEQWFVCDAVTSYKADNK